MSTETADPRFDSVDDVRDRLRKVDYLSDESIAGIVYLADRLGKPILVEGPAGTGKTQLAKSVAEISGARLIRLQCYEGLDESKALYEWNYKKQLLRIQASRGESETAGWDQIEEDIFSDDFLLTRPLLEAIRAEDPVVLLIDEVDRVEVETEALLLEILSDYQVSIPELGTITARQIPMVFLTSNNTRELSEALKRRCLYLHVDYPDQNAELQIVNLKVPGLSPRLASQAVELVQRLRGMDLKKHPSVSETIDWARALVELVRMDASAMDRYPHQFSGGQRQRLCIARALMMDPELLVADEPVSALDVSVQAQVLRLFEEIKTRLNVAMLFITHDLRVASQVCDFLAVMSKGRVVEYGPAHRVFGAPEHEYTQALFAAAPGRDFAFGA